MSLRHELEMLERAALIQATDASGSITFKHALLQETAYASLLKSDRRNIHFAAAQALERLYPNQRDEFAALLAFHYDRAEQPELAIQYALRAGDLEARRFADAEAIAHYTRAIELGNEHSCASPAPFIRRSELYERAGNFETAQDDLEQGLALARAQADRHCQWQCLMGLGFLWSARDYTRSGEYFEMALEHAIESRDRAMIAHNLNRIGNWFTNVERLGNAFDYHQRALEMFQELNDKRGLAESYDLLGMCMILSGDTIACARYYARAIELMRELDDRRGQSSCQQAFAFLHRNYDTDLVAVEHSFAESAPLMHEALQLAKEIGWRAGEAFALSQLGISYASQGMYTRALEYAKTSLSIAEAIQHHQWIVGALYANASIHTELLDADYAQAQFERGLEIATKINSVYWVRMMQAWLGIALIGQRKIVKARALLDDTLRDDLPMETISQRRLWSARVLLALAEQESATALQITEQLIATTKYSETRATPLLGYMQGRALVQLQEFDRAESVLRAALAQGEHENTRPLLWRIEGTLAAALAGQAQTQANAMFEQARRHILELVQELPPETPDLMSGKTRPLRAIFETRALARLEHLREVKQT